MDAFSIDAGISFWYGFSFCLFIHVMFNVLASLTPLKAKAPGWAHVAMALRIVIALLAMFGLFGFAGFLGQLSSSPNVTAIALLVGIGTYLGTRHLYQRMKSYIAARDT